MLGEQIPETLTDSTREAHLLGMLGDAARESSDRGESLILIVDGLDEDRGVTTGFDAHSIAGLLPDPPPNGLRVIVSGRPNPPIPSDVARQHPLRDPSIRRELSPSPHAEAMQVEMERELLHLLKGEPLGRELLGFITAAGGGLTARDLSELTSAESRWEVEQLLRSVVGRSFANRPAQWRRSHESEVYLLGHEELQQTAKRMIGIEQLHKYQTMFAQVVFEVSS